MNKSNIKIAVIGTNRSYNEFIRSIEFINIDYFKILSVDDARGRVFNGIVLLRDYQELDNFNNIINICKMRII